jgi:hypothetical protein
MPLQMCGLSVILFDMGVHHGNIHVFLIFPGNPKPLRAPGYGATMNRLMCDLGVR